MSRDPLDRLREIRAACAKIVRHTAGLSRDEAFADELRLDETIRPVTDLSPRP